VAYFSPLVPPEWIAAHGLEPRWQPLGPAVQSRNREIVRGACPYAQAIVAAADAGLGAAALVLTTTCDQMRHTAALVEQAGNLPVFLMHVPATWQTPAARLLYRDELQRLGQFLVRLGGTEPDAPTQIRVMRRYEEARHQVLSQRASLSGRGFAKRLAHVRGSLMRVNGHPAEIPSSIGPTKQPDPAEGIPLALVGGPVLESDYMLFDAVEAVGGRVVLDATEGGERTLPAGFDPHRMKLDPLDALVEAYFGHIPDVFRRPNTGLYDWLGRELQARAVRGILFRRYLWCDLWHAEWQTLRDWSPVPMIDFDVVQIDPSAEQRILGRLEAFCETLSCRP
jgi:benzoyl-CoA reductase/2-hydroxyglutaryl-CoA dehydratase subunit BcrC/BadD/HgdB